jgi:thioredoxin 1
MGMPVVEVTDATFEKEVLKSEIPVLVDFWAPWCGPCRALAPVMEELAEELSGKVKVCKLNTAHSQEMVTKYGIRAIPTLMLFNKGELAGHLLGARPKEQLQEWVDSLLK